MTGRLAEVAAVSALATIITVVMAAPVLRSPSDRLFGMAIVGRHHDPFTVIRQFDGPLRIGVYSQPITDVAGAMLARVAPPVAAYNWLVLLSFPFSAAAAYMLARHLAVSRTGSTVAAMAYAFAPFHVAHAAYHPHIAQTQWIPLYLLALWRCLDAATPVAAAWLGAAAMAVTLSNFYGGLIAAVITPVAVAAYWLTKPPGHRSTRPLAITLGMLVIVAGAGLAYASYAAGALITNRSDFAFPRADLFRYSAKWWSYLVPPVEHPLFGAVAQPLWHAVGVDDGLLEQQVSLGWGIIALGLVAIAGWLLRDGTVASLARVPVLVAVALTALLCSLSPERTIAGVTFVRPAALLYEVAPMFRSYARFGVVVQLMAAVLAGIGVERLRRLGTPSARMACVALLAIAAVEYAVWPPAMWRHPLPTAAHRWVVQQGNGTRVLDCTPLTPESESIQWLTGGRVAMMSGSFSDCTEPNLPQKLAAHGFTHLLVRTAARGPWRDGRAPDGLRTAARFDDGQVLEVTAATPVILTTTMTGFHRRESDAEWAWRWMGGDAEWTVMNTSPRPIVATLDLEVSAFHQRRQMEVRLDGRHQQTLAVDSPRRTYQIGPLVVLPGEWQMTFRPIEPPTVVSDVIHSGDGRRLSFAFGTWSWRVQGAQP